MSTSLLLTPLPDPRPAAVPVSPHRVAPSDAPTLPLHLVEPLATPLVTGADPAAVATALRLARAVGDLASGRRTPAQLVRWTTGESLAALATWARGQAGVSWSVQSFRAQQPAPAVVESCARLATTGGRSIAVALRLERTADQWVCAVADLGPRPRVERPGAERLQSRRR